ncbi:MAG: hypothetical protein R3C03_06500 [Pirellulaceae bacterium]
MSGQFNKHGIQFLYPENWSLTADEDWDLPYAVHLESPDGAMLSLFFLDAAHNNDDFLKEMLVSIEEQYETPEVSPGVTTLNNVPGSGVDANFYCLDFLVTTQIRIFECGDLKLASYCQAENRTFDKTKLVFDAVITSVLQGLAQRA